MQIELKKIENNPNILEELLEEIPELIITKNNQPIYKLTRINQPNQKIPHQENTKDLTVIDDWHKLGLTSLNNAYQDDEIEYGLETIKEFNRDYEKI